MASYGATFKKNIKSFVFYLKKTKKNMENVNLKKTYEKYYKGLYKNTGSQATTSFTPAFAGQRIARSACDADDVMPGDPTWLDWNIRRRGSHIYFYEEINPITQMILEVMLRDAVRDVLTSHVGEILGGELSESVTIHLNSPGGYLSCGLALYDYIKTSQIPITCLVEGLCASAATLVMLACHNRIMSPNSVYLMHQCSWGAWGENRFMQDMAVNADKAMKRLRKIYMAETKIAAERQPQEREAYIQHLLEHDFELDATECEDFGICTACDDDDDEVELSDERVEKVKAFVKKMAVEQKKENAKKEEEEKKVDEKKKTPTKKTPSKTSPKKKSTKSEESKSEEAKAE